MSSSVFYKFRSQRDESRIQFDGTGISVFDLKREILLANSFGKANDFDLALYDQHDQEYKDDSTIIARSSSVIVSRLPAIRPGKGRAALYLAGADLPASKNSGPGGAGPSAPFRGPSGPMSRRFDKEDPAKAPPGRSATSTPSTLTTGDEAASIAAMFAATEHQWEETQEKMSHAARIPFNNPRGGGPARKAYVPHTGAGQPQQEHNSRPTPPGYVCYRCGQKGHWIQDCPTNNDREYDHRPRIKRTTGIPRSFLKSVDQPTEGSMTAGVMITPEGGYVVAQPDAVSWQKQTTRTKTVTEADIRAKPPADASLACLLCSRLFREAVKTPCCGAVYCEECIQTHLLEHDFECPACHSKIPSLDKLVPEKAVRARVQTHIDKALAEANAAGSETGESGSATPNKASQSGAPSANALLDDIYNNDASSADHLQQQQHLFPEPPQIQAQIDQIHTMLRNPTLTPQARMQLQRQLPHLMSQLEQARMVATLAEAALSASAGGAAGFPSMNGMNMGMNGGGYGMNGAMMNGGGMMHGGGMGMSMSYQPGPSEYRPQWTNPFPNQQPASSESAYQRLPVNNRRRGMKRDRPSDFVEVGGDGPANKIARYWE